MNAAPRQVVIIGGGFAGLYAARALAKAAVTVTLIDRQNHHLFQPMLYQVATAALSPGDIASPIRSSWGRSPGSMFRGGLCTWPMVVAIATTT